MINLTLVTTEGCHTCKKVKELLHKLASSYDLSLDEVDATSERGQKLIKKYNISASPGIIVNNEFFASGNVTEEQFINKFDSLL